MSHKRTSAAEAETFAEPYVGLEGLLHPSPLDQQGENMKPAPPLLR
jgi:hypothetical protein